MVTSKNYKFCFAGFLLNLVLLTGCAQSPPITSPIQTTSKAAPEETQVSDKPDWVTAQPAALGDGSLSFTVSAPPQNMGGLEAQRRTATLLAQKELANYINSNVESVEVTSQRSDRGETDYQQYARVSSKVGISAQRYRVDKEWLDPVTGILYLRLLFPSGQ